MLIEEISLKNFKSFGNNKQKLQLNSNKGELILIKGKNGAGKSSLQQSIDFSLFGIVRGKQGKKISKSLLPNRINKNLETEIIFTNNFNQKIKIQRNLEPNSAKIFINDIDETKRAKNFNINELIGIDYDTYKNFISMSVSDFANFIDLNPEEKRNIINNLFNLSDLDNYFSLSNAKIKQYKDNILKLTTINITNAEAISAIELNIKNIELNNNKDKENNIIQLETEISSKKLPYLKMKNELVDFSDKIENLEKNIQELEDDKKINSNKIIEISVNLKNLKEKIAIYKTGICPSCNTSLEDDYHIDEYNTIKKNYKLLYDEYTLLNEKNSNLVITISQHNKNKNVFNTQKNSLNLKFNELSYDLKTIKNKISILKNDNKENVSTIELNNNIDNLNKKIIDNNIQIELLKNDIKKYEDLKNIFSNSGVRKNIISNIIIPLNIYIKETLKELNSPYDIDIDNDFNVNLYERFKLKINSETLSMGESKKINIAMALAYLKLILKYKKLNIIFLDEVFSSMEPENVDYVLNILKKYCAEFKLNIIILDPNVYFRDDSMFAAEKIGIFDRVIKMDKKLSFSTIEEIKN